MQVGEAFNKSKAYHELKLIASDPDEDHAFKVTNYMALDGLLNKLQESIIRVEGEAPGPWPPCGGPLSIQREARGPPASPHPRHPPKSLQNLRSACRLPQKNQVTKGPAPLGRRGSSPTAEPQGYSQRLLWGPAWRGAPTPRGCRWRSLCPPQPLGLSALGFVLCGEN